MKNPSMDGSTRIVIPSDLKEARRVQKLIVKQLRTSDFDVRERFAIRLSLEEAIVNAIKHGNQHDPEKKVEVRYHLRPDRIEIRVIDEGSGYNQGDLSDPCAEENLSKPSGRGLLLIRHYMTEVAVHPPGNQLVMIKVHQNGSH